MGQLSNFNNLVFTRTEEFLTKVVACQSVGKDHFPHILYQLESLMSFFLKKSIVASSFVKKLTFWCSLEIAHTFWF